MKFELDWLNWTIEIEMDWLNWILKLGFVDSRNLRFVEFAALTHFWVQIAGNKNINKPNLRKLHEKTEAGDICRLLTMDSILFTDLHTNCKSNIAYKIILILVRK